MIEVGEEGWGSGDGFGFEARLMSSYGRGQKPCPLCEESGFGGDVL